MKRAAAGASSSCYRSNSGNVSEQARFSRSLWGSGEQLLNACKSALKPRDGKCGRGGTAVTTNTAGCASSMSERNSSEKSRLKSVSGRQLSSGFSQPISLEKYPRRPSELRDLQDASGGMKPAKTTRAIPDDPAAQKLSVQCKGRKISYLSCLLGRWRLRTAMCSGPPSHPELSACPCKDPGNSRP